MSSSLCNLSAINSTSQAHPNVNTVMSANVPIPSHAVDDIMSSVANPNPAAHVRVVARALPPPIIPSPFVRDVSIGMAVGMMSKAVVVVTGGMLAQFAMGPYYFWLGILVCGVIVGLMACAAASRGLSVHAPVTA